MVRLLPVWVMSPPCIQYRICIVKWWKNSVHRTVSSTSLKRSSCITVLSHTNVRTSYQTWPNQNYIQSYPSIYNHIRLYVYAIHTLYNIMLYLALSKYMISSIKWYQYQGLRLVPASSPLDFSIARISSIWLFSSWGLSQWTSQKN